jgi:hypothetical protein
MYMFFIPKAKMLVHHFYAKSGRGWFSIGLGELLKEQFD